jgi:hypothetical protein
MIDVQLTCVLFATVTESYGRLNFKRWICLISQLSKCLCVNQFGVKSPDCNLLRHAEQASFPAGTWRWPVHFQLVYSIRMGGAIPPLPICLYVLVLMGLSRTCGLRSALLWNFTQRRVVCYRRFGTTHRSHLGKGQAVQEDSSWTAWPLHRGYFLGVKRPEPEVDHSPPSRAQVKNEWKYTSVSRIRLHIVERDFIFYS